MNLNLSNKNALVCGSSRGIGKAAAIELSALGANVTLVSRSAEKMADVIHDLDHSNSQHHDFLVADFQDSKELKKRVHTLVRVKPIHILINNTGGPPSGSIIEAKPEDFTKAFHNHLVCNQLLVQSVLDGMKQAKYGRIINVISTSVKQPLNGLGVSNTIRGAVASWAKTMANELGSFGITVNNVLPGKTDTERLQELVTYHAEKSNMSEEAVRKKFYSEIPVGRFAEPKEVANAIAFLASPAAAYINGINLPVDGGRTKSL